MTTACPESSPDTFANTSLFEPIEHLLRAFASLPELDALNHLREHVAPEAASGSGKPIRFVTAPDGVAYEEHVFATGEVPTRANNWHDFFNALAWCVWPATKAACNALHLAQIAQRRMAGEPGRGRTRDALTQFDECGILVVSTDLEMPTLLASHEWEEAFWNRRAQLMATTRFLIFGHGSWDQLRSPFHGLCAKAIYRTVSPDWLGLPRALQQADADRWLAAWFEAHTPTLTPRAFAPLPLLGIPGVTPDNTQHSYYRDTRQFRPRR